MDLADLDRLRSHVDSLVAVKNVLDGAGVAYSSHLSGYWGRHWEYSTLVESLGNPSGLTVLDVGGMATLLPYYLVRLGCQVKTVDPAEMHLQEANEIAQRIPEFVGVENCQGYGQSMGFFPDSTFDRVFSVCVIEHLPDRENQGQMMKEMIRVLKPGGILGMTYDVLEEPERSRRTAGSAEIGPFASEDEVWQYLLWPIYPQATLYGNTDLWHPAQNPGERIPGGLWGSIGSLFLQKAGG